MDWTDAEQLDAHTIRVHFTQGDPACYGARAAVVETADRIRVSVFVGALPGAPPVCTAIGMLASITVTTKDPIGTRQVTGS